MQHIVAYMSLFIYGSGSIRISISISSLPPLRSSPFTFPIKHLSSPRFYPSKYRAGSGAIPFSYSCSCFFLFQKQNRRFFLFELCGMWNSVALSQRESIIFSLTVFLYSALPATLARNIQPESPYLCLTCGIISSLRTHTHTHSKGFSEA